MISPRIRRIIREENCFDGLPEQAGNAEGKTQARVISACLQRVNGLPGDSQFTSKNGLTPVVVLTQCPELIFHNLCAARSVPPKPSICQRCQCVTTPVKGPWHRQVVPPRRRGSVHGVKIDLATGCRNAVAGAEAAGVSAGVG